MARGHDEERLCKNLKNGKVSAASLAPGHWWVFQQDSNPGAQIHLVLHVTDNKQLSESPH